MAPPWPTVAEVEACENVETCLRWNRFLPSPANDGQVAVINAVVKRLRELRARDDGAYVAASKNLGWGP
ncbi:MAG TPA: hypothetical protein VN903_25510 [Polyangia bacterium]|nr:hypothetical protein [Polyangia bacterium]